MTLRTVTGSVTAGSGVTLLARIRGAVGQLLTQASLSSISYVVSDLTAGTQTGSGTFTVSSVVFDDLVTDDPRWTRDGPTNPGPDGSFGYNFLAVIPASAFPATDLANYPKTPHRYQVDVTFTPASGEAWKVPFSFVPTRVWG